MPNTPNPQDPASDVHLFVQFKRWLRTPGATAQLAPAIADAMGPQALMEDAL